MLRITQVATVLLIAASTFAVSPQAAPTAIPGVSISGSGIVNATDDFGATYANAGQFAISAGLRPDGSAYGSLNVVGRGGFAAAWGACPYDPRCVDYPNTATKTFHLSGQVHSLVSIGSEVVASGTLTEIDHGKGDGVIFEEYDVPFSVTATEGSNAVVLQFCLLPPFTLELANGNLSVSAGSPQTKLFERPGQSQARALSCHGPQTASR